MFRAIVAIALVLGSASALAVKVVSQPEKGVELSLAMLTLPGGASGTIRFRTCEDCQLEQHRVTAQTRYFVDNQEVPLADFALTANGIRQQGDGLAAATFVGVYIDVASQNVNRIKLSRRKR